jgi:hypothetical protein
LANLQVKNIYFIGEFPHESRQLAKLQVKNIYFIGEFPHEFRQLANFPTNFANGESTVGERMDWRTYIDSRGMRICKGDDTSPVGNDRISKFRDM